MHLTEILTKKELLTKKWRSTKIMRFLSITPSRRFLRKSMHGLWDPHKLTDFFTPMNAYFEEKNSTLLSGFCHFL